MAGILTEGLASQAEAADLDQEFERRLADSGALAFRVAYGVLRQRQDAEDVAQEALIRAYRKRGSLRDRERFRSWLVRICWRLALDYRKAGKRRERRELAAAEPEPAPDAEQVAAASEFRARLERAIDGLPGKLRVVVVLAGIEGYEMGEVAALLGLPEGTVKSRLHLARKRLAETMK